MNTVFKKLTRIGEDILEMIMPNHYKCFGCGKSDGYYESFLCKSCLLEIDFSHLSCRICGAKLDSVLSICNQCRLDGLSVMFDRIYPCAYYNEFAKNLLHRYKYLHERYLSRLFAKMLFDKLTSEHVQFDAIIPITSGAHRIRNRGFDHIDDLCRELSKLADKQVLRLLKRVHHEIPQVEKSYTQRLYDMENSFVFDETLSASYPESLKILLVDDLYTTGSTIRSAGSVLKKHYKHISAVTVFHG